VEKLNHLFKKNLEWAAAIKKQDPDFFTELAGQQSPKILWIGCADSRVPANQIIDLPPGEVFVHRNIANVVVYTDLNCLSVIQYAVDVLKVEHVVVCGHYGCGGVKAAMSNDSYGLIDNWLRHIKDVIRFNKTQLDNAADIERFDLLCELNVKEQVSNVCNTSIVQQAWQRGAKLNVHGWIYDINNGILKDLDVSMADNVAL